MVDIHVVETVMVDTEEAVEVDLEEVAVADSEEDVGVVEEAVEAVTTAIKMVISPANALNNAKNGIKYRGPSFAVSESKIQRSFDDYTWAVGFQQEKTCYKSFP